MILLFFLITNYLNTKHYTLLVSLIFCGSIYAQEYPSLSRPQHSIGGSENDWGTAIVMDKEGNFLLGTSTYSFDGYVHGWHGNTDFWTVKINGITGDTIWTSRALGGGDSDWLISAIVTADGNFVVAGRTQSSDGDVQGLHGGTDFWTVKLDGSTGAVIWISPALGGSSWDGIGNIFETSDRHIVLAGTVSSFDGDVRGFHGGSTDFWAVKLNGNTGDTIWTSRALGGSGSDEPKATFESVDGHVILAGYTSSSDGDIRGHHWSLDFWVVKLDAATGDTIWTSRGIGGNGADVLVSACNSPDGHLFLGGWTNSSDGDIRSARGLSDFWAVKLNRNTGDTIWTSTALGGSDLDEPRKVFASEDGHLILAGETYSSDGNVSGQHGETDLWAVKLDGTTGEVLVASPALGGSGMEEFFNMFPTCDGGYLLSGDTYTLSPDGDITQSGPADCNDPILCELIWMVKVDSLFNVEWDKVWADSNHAEAGQVFPTVDGGYFFTGLSKQTAPAGNKNVSGNGLQDIWISKIYWLEAGFMSDTSVCAGTPVLFSDTTKGVDAITTGLSWYWDFGDGNESTLQEPTHIYTDSGTYLVRQVVHKECQWDTVKHFITVIGPQLDLGSDSSFCYPDTVYTLDAGNNVISYQWSTEDTSQMISVYTSGQYSVWMVDKNGCTTSDTIQISFDQSENCTDLFSLFIPSSFSPEGNGINDVWLVRVQGINDWKLTVYNRQGKIVYEGADMKEGWNGMLKEGNYLIGGIYLYHFEGWTTEGKNIKRIGNVTLVN